MSAALWVGLAIFVVGVGLRLWASKPFMQAYGRAHAGEPPLGWLWTPSPDAEVERWRRRRLAGTALMWIGAIIAIINPAV